MKYSFNPEIAKDVGVECAILFSNIQWRCETNKANKKNEINGKYFTYNTYKAYSELFPFWSEHQIRRFIKKLVDKNYIIKETHNKAGYDKTSWYAIGGNRHIDVAKSPDGSDEIVTPIPDNKPDNKKPNKIDYKKELEELVNDWNSIVLNSKFNKIKRLPKIIKVNDDFKSVYKKKRKEYTVEEIREGLNNYIKSIENRKLDQNGEVFNHIFTLHTFLKQHNGLDKFINLPQD